MWLRPRRPPFRPEGETRTIAGMKWVPARSQTVSLEGEAMGMMDMGDPIVMAMAPAGMAMAHTVMAMAPIMMAMARIAMIDGIMMMNDNK